MLLQAEYKTNRDEMKSILTSKAKYIKKLEEEEPNERVLRIINLETEYIEKVLAFRVSADGLIKSYDKHMKNERERLVETIKTLEEEARFWKKQAIKEMEDQLALMKIMREKINNQNVEQ